MSKISSFVVSPPPTNLENGEKIPALGKELFETPYSNIFICAQKRSGKTNLIRNILDRCADETTMVHIFCPTVDKDETWTKLILPMLDRKNIAYEKSTEFIEGKKNHLIDFMKEEQFIAEAEKEEMEKEEKEREKEKSADTTTVIFHGIKFDKAEAPSFTKVENRKKKEKPKYIAPRHIIILDDLGDAMRDKSVAALLKTNFHYKSKIILSAQFITDLQPAAIRQLEYVIMFQGIPIVKLEQIHEKITVPMPFAQFKSYYDVATKEKYHFMYIDVKRWQIRKDFNLLLTR